MLGSQHSFPLVLPRVPENRNHEMKQAEVPKARDKKIIVEMCKDELDAMLEKQASLQNTIEKSQERMRSLEKQVQELQAQSSQGMSALESQKETPTGFRRSTSAVTVGLLTDKKTIQEIPVEEAKYFSCERRQQQTLKQSEEDDGPGTVPFDKSMEKLKEPSLLSLDMDRVSNNFKLSQPILSPPLKQDRD